MNTFSYRGYVCETTCVKVPGGNDFYGVKVLGTNIHAAWEIVKAALDKAAKA